MPESIVVQEHITTNGFYTTPSSPFFVHNALETSNTPYHGLDSTHSGTQSTYRSSCTPDLNNNNNNNNNNNTNNNNNNNNNSRRMTLSSNFKLEPLESEVEANSNHFRNNAMKYTFNHQVRQKFICIVS